MSESVAPLTYEGILELFRQSDLRFKQWLQDSALEFDRRMQELDKQMKETDKQIERTSKEVSSLGSRVGEIVENMVGGDIDKQFQALGYNVTAQSRNKTFGEEKTNDNGEIDLLLEDGDVAILIEAKTKLKVDDVHGHIKRLEKYRAYLNKTGKADRWQLVGAVAAASAHPEVIKFAQRQGLYVIIQTGRMVEIITPPEGFVAKTW
jgi:hypothetical protein